MEASVRMESDLNARAYAPLDLTPAEIKIIEESTKYDMERYRKGLLG